MGVFGESVCAGSSYLQNLIDPARSGDGLKRFRRPMISASLRGSLSAPKPKWMRLSLDER